MPIKQFGLINKKIFQFIISVGVLLCLCLTLPGSTAWAQLPDVCQSSENVLPNCHFSDGKGNWQVFTEDGGANFDILQGGGECHAPLCPAAYIVTEGHFVGGIYQQVPVTTGNTYYANIIWLVFDSLSNDAGINGTVGGIGRRIGIDPTGGTDSRSPNVVWSEDNWRNDCKICGVEYVTATAQADLITVFLRLDDTWRVRAAEKGFAIPPSKDQFWIDDIGMKQTDGEAPAPTPQPTEPPPPTDTPVPPPPATEEPTAEDEAIAVEAPQTEQLAVAAVNEDNEETEAVTTETEESEPTDETPPTLEATAESPVAEVIAAAPPTLTPTNTPPPTATAVARVAAVPPAEPTGDDSGTLSVAPERETSGFFSTESLSVVGPLACFSGFFLLLMVIVLAGLAWLYRLGWGDTGNNDDDEPDDEDDRDGYLEDIEVEILD